MLAISQEDIERRIRRDNPWWENKKRPFKWNEFARRDYFRAFYEISTDSSVRRSTVLLGPRRVGKTVMLHHFIYELISSDFDPLKIMYISIDTPVYTDISLEKFVDVLFRINNLSEDSRCYIIFDEIQYLKNWETHLKDLTDVYSNIRFIASGSAAAALRLKSRESGAGRFTDFMLPPLTFLEFLKFIGHLDNCVSLENDLYQAHNISALNKYFIEYINYGGFPEVAMIEKMKDNIDQFVKNDIIDKVLLKDLPNLYGIQNIQDLNNIFKLLAYNNGQEVGLEAIAQQSQINKLHIKSFIEYLDNAFLISRHDKLPTSGKQIVRKRNFKIFLTNPSMRAALFSPVSDTDHKTLGHLAEAAILSQWDHLSRQRQKYYYRDGLGNEVDSVGLEAGTFQPIDPVEIKWSDRSAKHPRTELKGLLYFMHKYNIDAAITTSKTNFGTINIDDKNITFIPTSVYCLNIGATTSQAAIASRQIDAPEQLNLLDDEI
ncbi:ATP-binding protein [Methylobacterium sp. EM32]|uniref:ATP-binding protein n=1 Tax=Methylobacterium sp. EM32 TaxID=3163481 RepID=UPI0033A07CE6